MSINVPDTYQDVLDIERHTGAISVPLNGIPKVGN